MYIVPIYSYAGCFVVNLGLACQISYIITITTYYNLTKMSQGTTLGRLLALDTDIVSDALHFLGLQGAVCGLRPLWDCPKIAGRASTVKLALSPDASLTTHPLASVLDEATTGNRILVVSGGIDGVSCWDHGIDNAWKAKGIRGIIVDGMIRDDDSKREAGYPVYGRGVATISERNQVAHVGTSTPLQIRGVVVRQDDYVIADSSGTVFVSAERIEQVLQVGERIHHRRTLAAQAVESGLPVQPDVMSDLPLGAAASSMPNPKKAIAEDQELVALFAGLSTPGVSDALDKLGIPGQALNIMPLAEYKHVTVGPAFTVRYVPQGESSGNVGDYIDDVAAGDIVVIDNGGRTDCTVWGDIMTQYAGSRGIAGTVIDGVCRDVDRAITDEYPLFTVGRWMRTAKDRLQVGGVNETIGIGRVCVQPRDIVVADVNGVVIVPRRRAREVAGLARWIDKMEANIKERIADGATLGQARAEFSYHQLQRKG